MKITSIKSHVLKYELEKELGYSQQYYKHRTAHLVEVQTDEGITGWGECFGPGNIALANKYIVEKVIQPLVIDEDPLNKEHIWQKVYNLLRDSGQKGHAYTGFIRGRYSSMGYLRKKNELSSLPTCWWKMQ